MRTNGNRNGFSMIEVLVASAILVVIVMMLAMLFQQTSLSWRTGVKRADAYMQVRSGIGAIQRDASAAVDARAIPQVLRSRLAGSQQFASGLRFFTLSGDGFEDGNNNGSMDASELPYRALSYITYDMNGKRTETLLRGDGSVLNMPQANVLNFIKNQTSANKPTTVITKIEPEYGANSPQGLPLYVKIRARVEYAGNSLEIGAASAGPDKTWGTKDDINTWK